MSLLVTPTIALYPSYLPYDRLLDTLPLPPKPEDSDVWPTQFFHPQVFLANTPLSIYHVVMFTIFSSPFSFPPPVSAYSGLSLSGVSLDFLLTLGRSSLGGE